MPATEPSTPTPRLVAFFAANVALAAGLWAHAFLYNFYLQELGHPDRVLGWAAASLTAGGLIALWPAGLAVDRWGVRLVYAAAALLAGAGLAAGALAEQPAAIYAAAVLAGLGAASWRVSMGPALMRLTRGTTRARAFSWNVALLVGSGALWTALSGRGPAWFEARLGTGTLGGLRATLLVGGALSAAAAVAAVVLRFDGRPGDEAEPDRDASRPPDAASLLDRLSLSPRLLRLVGLAFVWAAAGAVVLPFFNVYFQRVHALSVERISDVFATTQVVTALALIGGAELSRALGPRRAFAAWAMLFAPALWVLAPGVPFWAAAAFYALASLAPPATTPLIDQLLLEEAEEAQHGVVSGWRNGANEASGLVGASAGGFLLEWGGFGLLFGVAGALAALGAAALWATLAPDRR